MPKHHHLLSLSVGLLAISHLALAQSVKSVPATLPTTRLTIFNNGTFFHKQEGDVEVSGGHASFGIANEQVLKGTYWIGTDKGSKINQIVFGVDTVKKQKTAITQEDLIQANIGKTAILTLSGGTNGASKEYAGTIKGYEPTTGMVKLALADGKNMLITHAERITEIALPLNANGQYSQDTIVKSANLAVSGSSGKLPLQVVSLQQGMMWHPSYLLKLEKDKTARLQMKASITNTALNVNNVEADLVVGNPEMTYGSELDPISGGHSTYRPDQDQEAQNQPQLYQARRGKASRNQAMVTMSMAQDNGQAEMVSNENQSTNGESKQGLYYYRTGKISLQKNEVAVIPIFNLGLTYNDYYEAEIPDANPVYYNRAVFASDVKYPAYHRVSFFNKGAVPLTNAPVMVLDDKEEPLCQSSLSYVPVGGEAKINISRSQDIVVKYLEEEIDRSLNLKKLVDKITVRGKIVVSNLQNKDILLKVTKHINGDIITVSNEGKGIKSGRYMGRNAVARAEWNLTLKAGAVLELGYDYKVLLDN